MSTATVEFDTTGIGVWTEEERFDVTAERIAEYAAATNDPIERHLRGAVAPPVFAVVPVFTSMAPAALSIAPVELLMKLVHGEQDFRFHRPIYPGDSLISRSKPIGFAGKDKGSVVVIYAETRSVTGELVNEQWMTAFFRNVDAGSSIGETAPGHRFNEALRAGEPDIDVLQRIDADQTFRYSPASGDPMPIHLDDEIAKMAGLPGIINHGLCTMAFTSWAALTQFADGEVERLRRLAVRFAKPVLPTQQMATQFWRLPQSDSDATTYAYETVVGENKVITDGLAVISNGRTH